MLVKQTAIFHPHIYVLMLCYYFFMNALVSLECSTFNCPLVIFLRLDRYPTDRLIHLRYLGLGRVMWEIPDTIGNLKALQTISSESNRGVVLPKPVVKLENLKHIIGNFIFLGDWTRSSVLETLEGISYKQWCRLDARNMVNLRHLFLMDFYEEGDSTLERFHDNFKYLSRLQSLAMVWYAPHSFSYIVGLLGLGHLRRTHHQNIMYASI